MLCTLLTVLSQKEQSSFNWILLGTGQQEGTNQNNTDLGNSFCLRLNPKLFTPFSDHTYRRAVSTLSAS